MKCQITGTPDQQIEPPEYEYEDEDEDYSKSPIQLVESFLKGDKNSFIDLDKINDNVLALDFKSFIELYSHFKFDQELKRDENRGELLLLIDEFLIETIVDYIK